MTAHHTILRNICDALTASTAIRDWCIAQYGRGCQVQLDAYGAQGLPTEDDAPYIFIWSDGDVDGGAEIDEETFEAVLVAAVLSPTSGGADITVASARTASSNGLRVLGCAEKSEHLRGLALDAIKAAGVGAVYRKATLTESGTLDYPLQWARARMSFYEPKTFDD